MIWAALAGLIAMVLFGGGDDDPGGKVFDRIEERIGEHVKDKTRRSAAESVVDEMRKTREGIVEKIEGLAERLSKAHADHATPRAETERILDEIDSIRKASWTKQIDARFKLRESLTREEWAKVFPALGR